MLKDNKVTEVRSVRRESERGQRIFVFKVTQLIWLLFGILEAMIALRIVLKLIAANPNSPFAVLIYGITALFLIPFDRLIESPAIGNMVLELSSFIAMLVYALIGWAIERIIWVLFYRPRGPVVDVTQTTSSENYTHRQ